MQKDQSNQKHKPAKGKQQPKELLRNSYIRSFISEKSEIQAD